MKDMDPTELSAFAVYRNLIPGVKSYKDTNSPAGQSKNKKRKRKQKLQLAANGNGKSAPTTQAASPILPISPVAAASSPKIKKNKRKKLARAAAAAALALEEREPEPVVESPPAKREKRKKKETILDPELLLTSEPVWDSPSHGSALLTALLSPTPLPAFFSDYWEKKPLFVPAAGRDYTWILNSDVLDRVLRKNVIQFGKNIDVTSFVDGVRSTLNPEGNGRAMPAVVWDYYSNGCSVRFLNPQTYVKPLWRLNASLQEYFGTFVGANVYLTPPDSQGFAPHYDDIEAFIIQIEGKKHWKLYAPRTENEVLPRFSSGNFNEEKDGLDEPIFERTLEAGDLMYFPRGTIHQARAVEGCHSLHVTISCYQTNTWGDFITEYLPLALEKAVSESVELRQGLPTDYLSYMGVAHTVTPGLKKQRKSFKRQVADLSALVLKQTSTLDLAADVMGKKYMWDSLPPFLTAKERARTSFQDGEFLYQGRVYNRSEFEPDTLIKLIRKNCARVVIEENGVRLYYTSENSLEYHGEPETYIEVVDEAGTALDFLVAKYPEFTRVDDLPIRDEEVKFQLVADMWEKGLLLTKDPLAPIDGVSLEDQDEESLSDESYEDLDSADLIESEDEPPPKLIKADGEQKKKKRKKKNYE